MHAPPLDPPRFARALRILCRRDARLAGLVRRVGSPALPRRRQGFRTLVRILLEQQVSLASAAAVFRRLDRAAGRLTPAAIASMDDDALRGAGLSGPRIRRVRALAEACRARTISLGALARADDDGVRDRLTRIHGIGPWTADVYLMFALRRPDVWPVGDHALAVAVQKLLGLERRPGPGRLEAIGARWAPWRTVAAHALWHASLADRVSTTSRGPRRRRAAR